MTITHRIVASAIAMLSLTACSPGVHFVNSATNLPVPPTLQNRTLWDDASIPQYKPEVLIGYVLERSSAADKWKRKKQVIPENFNTVPEVIKEGLFYTSIVDSSIAANGSGQIPILSAAAKLSNKQRMEMTIEDAALLLVPDKDIPWTTLGAYVKENPRPAGASRVWIQAVMLTKMYLKVATETNVDATVSGAAYAADSKVFNQNSAMQRQPYITLLLVDLDELEEKARRSGEPDRLAEAAGTFKAMGGRSIYRAITVPKGGIE